LPPSLTDGGNASVRALPLVYLNHFYAVLDSATYRSLEQSPFWRKDFAPNETRTTVRTDETYTGLYFYGRETYFEVFDVANSPRPQVGDFGLAFGVDEPGGSAALKGRLGSELTIGHDPITRFYNGKQIPWFYMATFTSIPYASGSSSWVMEYHPDFLARWNPRLGGGGAVGAAAGGGRIRRRDVLERYADTVERVKDPYLEDVTGLTIGVDQATSDRFVARCGQMGYGIQRGEGAGVTLDGPAFTLRLTSANDGIRGVREVVMQTRRAFPRATPWEFGRSDLRVDGRRAVLSLH
jgi:hypothetical protein